MIDKGRLADKPTENILGGAAGQRSGAVAGMDCWTGNDASDNA
jgi:hypothetical protein